jgi:hypothetical protein
VSATRARLSAALGVVAAFALVLALLAGYVFLYYP